MPGFIYRPTGSITEDTIYNRRRVTDTYPRGIQLEAPSIALVVAAREIIGVGILKRGDAVTTFSRRISIEDLDLLLRPVDVDKVIRRVALRVRRHATEAFRTGGPLPPQTWRHVREVLAGEDELNALIDRHERRASPPSWVQRQDERPRHIVEQEQDAFGLALSLSGFERQAMTTWTAPADPAPFLAGLEHIELREDQLLINDMQVFGDWSRAAGNGLWVEFTGRDGQRVTIMNVNRHQLETTLGVDLIYYSHTHEAFTIVQYKRMRWESPGPGPGRQPVYRPAHDKNIRRQLSRMRKIEEGADTGPVSRLVDYRLGRSACFLKICVPDLELGTSELSRGMYMDLDLWDVSLTHLSKAESNPAISFDRETRYLNNSEFIELVRQGWIGSRDVTTAKIAQFIDTELRSKHSVTLATTTVPGVRGRLRVRRDGRQVGPGSRRRAQPG